MRLLSSHIFVFALIFSAINGYILGSNRPTWAKRTLNSSFRLLNAPSKSFNVARNDTFVEKVAIFSLSMLLSFIAPDPTRAIQKCGFEYKNFVETAKHLLEYKSPDIIRSKIVSLIVRILPGFVRDYFRSKYLESPQLVAMLSVQWFEFGFLHWLVGPVIPKYTSALRSEDDEFSSWNNTVKLLECRFLKESGCKAACNLLCKRPTQSLFIENLGMPLYMRPNFTDYSCEMIFGVEPPKDNQDEAFIETCYSGCSLLSAPAALVENTSPTRISCAKATEVLVVPTTNNL
jgi:hypothetical protein